MRRNSSATIAAKSSEVLAKVERIKGEHPFWGYRRVWSYLTYVLGEKINKKRVYRMMREHNLLVEKNQRLKAVRGPIRPKPRAERPNQWWGIDMTKIKTVYEGWAYVVVVKDWYTKKIVGHYTGEQSKSLHWQIALERAVLKQCSDGSRGKRISLMSDNGCQPTSESFMAKCSVLGIRQVFTNYSNPKGNADTERVIRTMKEEVAHPREHLTIFSVEKSVNEWVEFYNRIYPHSSIGYKAPEQFEKEFFNQQKIPLAAA